MNPEAAASYSALRCHEDGGKNPERFLDGMVFDLTVRGAGPETVSRATNKFHELVGSDEIALLSKRVNSRKGEE